MNIVILPERYQTLTTQGWTNVLLGNQIFEDPFSKNGKQNVKKRILDIMSKTNNAQNHQGNTKNTIEDAIKRIQEPNMLIITLENLKELLEFFESGTMEWHTMRGLPKELIGKKDVMSFAQKNQIPGYYEYFIEYCVFGLKENGYFL